MTDTLVEVNDVTKRFGGNVAANSITLSVKEGEFFSLLGPSGCGKTTLLRMIAGFESPTSGSIFIDGKDVSKVPPHKRPVNMVFQNYALFPHLTIFDNVAFGLRSKGLRDAYAIRAKVEPMLDLVRLKDLATRFPSQLSGGQQQRVALARAVVNEPKVVLLDEPLSALDPQIREGMQEELANLQKKLNITFIMVTHDQDEALALSSRIAVFCKGNLEQIGTPEEIFERPETKFVAEFIGQTNLLDAEILERNGSTARLTLANKIELTVADNTKVSPQFSRGKVTAWIKPQAVRVLKEGSLQGAENLIEATVAHRSYQGACVQYRLKLKASDQPILELRSQSVDREQCAFTEGDPVLLQIEKTLSSFLVDDDCAIQADSKSAETAISQPARSGRTTVEA